MSSRVEWNIRRGTRAISPARAGRRKNDRAPGEAQVRFRVDLDPEEKIRTVLQVLTGLRGVDLKAVLKAAHEIFEAEENKQDI